MKDWPTIIYFGNDWTADNRTSSHHIARRLIRDHRVVYVECPGLRAPKGNKRDLGKIFSKLAKVFKGARALDERSHVFTLFQLPFHRFSWVRTLNYHLVVWSLRRLCKNLQIEKPILWFVLPHIAMVLGKLDESFKVYYCIDDYSSLPGVNQSMISSMDAKMSQECDAVFCSALPLLESKKQYGEKVKLSRHGVDFDHFNSVHEGNTKIAEEVKAFNHPVIGFFGLIENWIDLGMIQYAAEQRPDWHFLMIGRLAVDENPCQGLKNVHFIGSRTYEELPMYAKAFDVSTIPCVTNDLIYNFNPLKLREYLAMGKPVVSTYYPEVEAFSDVVEVVHSNEEFVKKIEVALSTDSNERINQRIEKVRSLSWENRYQDVISIVDTMYKKKEH